MNSQDNTISCSDLVQKVLDNPELSNLFGVAVSSTYLEYIEKLNQCSDTDK